MNYFFCVLIGYFIGGINPSYIISRVRGDDIRKSGSGNAGASNALMLFGKTVGLLCAMFDIAKAGVVVKLCGMLFPNAEYAPIVAGVSCIVGHIFPAVMKFRGGKGLACLGGMIFAYNPALFVIMLTYEIVVVLLTDYLCFVPITASVIFPAIHLFYKHDIIGTLILGVSSAAMLYKHVENVKRIRGGMEVHFSYLWNKDKEIERVKNNIEQ